MALNNLNNLSTFGGRKTRNNEGIKMNGKDVSFNTKRSAENSPGKDSKKRPVLGDVTNNNNWTKDSLKKGGLKGAVKTSNIAPTVLKQNKVSNKKSETNLKLNIVPEFSHLPASKLVESDPEVDVKDESVSSKVTPDVDEIKLFPTGVVDFDEEMMNDPFSEARYAQDIFEYYKQREVKFTIEKYLDRQPDMTEHMRAILIDWMVEVQESFELNHETLYLAVKLIDMFLVKQNVPKTMIQLVGATAALIASKYDERLPPLVDDFLYICDDSYSRSELLVMECSILKSVGFDLGIPISYRFLRRYARCSKIPMDTLTLARFILETSLMEYDLIDVRDSKIAAAALLLALKMKNNGEWTPTLQYYSGYQEEELLDLMKHLNRLISPPINRLTMTIRTKYSHPVFFEVAKIEPLNLD